MTLLNNKLDASIALSCPNKDGEEVGFNIIMDGDSAQLNVMVDGCYFAHIYINEHLKVEICFPETVGKAIEIDLNKK